jgi:hypothetical protein
MAKICEQHKRILVLVYYTMNQSSEDIKVIQIKIKK